MDDISSTVTSSSPCEALGPSKNNVSFQRRNRSEAALHTLLLSLGQLSLPQKVLIPERYVDSEPEEPLSPEEVEDRHRKVERIKSLLAKSR